MKIEIDFDNKVIRVCEKVNFKKLYDFVKKQEDWKEYKLDTQTEIKWGYYPYIYWATPSYYHDYTYTSNPTGVSNTISGTSLSDLTTGTYQIEIN